MVELIAEVLQKAVSFILPGVNVIPDTPSGVDGVTVNPEETHIWAYAVSGTARRKAAKSSEKNMAA